MRSKRLTPVIYIYGLIDPRSDMVYYVGQTINLKQRLTSHRARGGEALLTAKRWGVPIETCKHITSTQRYTGMMILNGYKPDISILEFTTAIYSVEREQFWIDKLRADGTQLTNFMKATRCAHHKPLLGQKIKWTLRTPGSIARARMDK